MEPLDEEVPRFWTVRLNRTFSLNKRVELGYGCSNRWLTISSTFYFHFFVSHIRYKYLSGIYLETWLTHPDANIPLHSGSTSLARFEFLYHIIQVLSPLSSSNSLYEQKVLMRLIHLQALCLGSASSFKIYDFCRVLSLHGSTISSTFHRFS